MLPLVPELLLVPVLVPELLDGEVVVDGLVVVVVLPEAPMPELVVDDDELGVDDVDELGVDDELAPGAPIDDEEDGVTLPLAVPPVAPMPDAVPEADPDIEGPELQAARAAAQAIERISLVMVELLC